jgi:hypothetical protein
MCGYQYKRMGLQKFGFEGPMDKKLFKSQTKNQPASQPALFVVSVFFWVLTSNL